MTLRQLAFVGLVLGTLHAGGADAPQMSKAFYRTEIIVFARDAPAEPGAEQMLVTEARSFAGPLAAFAVTDNARAAIYQLTDDEDLVPFRGAPATTVLRPRTNKAPSGNAATPPPPVVQPSATERARRSLAALEQRWLDESFTWLPTAQLTLKRESQQIARAPG